MSTAPAVRRLAPLVAALLLCGCDATNDIISAEFTTMVGPAEAFGVIAVEPGQEFTWTWTYDYFVTK